jgi:hypothetical protein
MWKRVSHNWLSRKTDGGPFDVFPTREVFVFHVPLNGFLSAPSRSEILFRDFFILWDWISKFVTVLSVKSQKLDERIQRNFSF